MATIDVLGDAAIGTIGPEQRIKRGEISAETVDELAERLTSNEFYDDISDELGPNAAGGTFSLVIADALTTNRFRQAGQTAEAHAVALYGWLMANKNDAEHRSIIPRVCVDGRLPVEGSEPNMAVIGGHDDEHGPDGCGAQKKLGPILEYIQTRGNDLRQFAAAHGVEIDDDTHDAIVRNAGVLLAEGYVSTGTELRGAYVRVAGEASVTKLAGDHKEVVGVLSKDKFKTLNRSKIRAAFGEGYDAFGIDVGVFPAAAAVISDGDEQEAWQKFVAMLYYNEATTTVLADHGLRIVEHPAA
jgi:hypothetical protein